MNAAALIGPPEVRNNTQCAMAVSYYPKMTSFSDAQMKLVQQQVVIV
mgnify:CR=1 FL=1